MKGIMTHFQLLFFSMMVFIAPLGAFALDPGSVKGSLTVDGKPVQLITGYAHLHDNAEKVLDWPKELRILLSDRDVDESTLRGLVFLEVESMAMEGKVQGVLIELNPEKPDKIVITYLYPPSREGAFLVRKTIGREKVFKEFKIANGRVSGEFLEPDEKFDVSVKFDVPLFKEPAITADLKGKEAKNSPYVILMGKSADAMIKGDLNALQKIWSAKAYKRFEAFHSQAGPEAINLLKQGGGEEKEVVKRISRVVVRGDRAVALIDGTRLGPTFVKENGEWKVGE
jgi:hypothetical protein